MTIVMPLYSLVNRIGAMALEEASEPSPQAHFELLQMIDQLRSAVETPTETVLCLIYQVNRFYRGRVVILTEDSLRKMLRCAP
jgi:hypothetical protein